MEKTLELDHQASYESAVIVFNYVVDLGSRGPRRAASRLLKAGIAETVMEPLDRKVALSSRFRKLAKTRADALAMADLHEAMQAKEFGPLSRRSKLILWRATAHAGLRKMRSKLLLREIDGKDSSAKQEDKTTSSLDSMRSTVDFIDSSMDDIRFRPLLNAAVDRKMFQQAYLVKRPFLRLSLRAVRVQFKDGYSEQKTEEQRVDVSLMLYRSGVAILSFEVELPRKLNSAQLLPLLKSSSEMFREVVFSEPVIMGHARRKRSREGSIAGKWDDEVHEGVKWRRISIDGENSSVFNLFDVYTDAIYEAVRPGRVDSDWFCHPTVFIDGLVCCESRERWMKQHAKELAGLAGRTRLTSLFEQSAVDKLLGDDHSLTSDRSFYVNSSLAIDVKWHFTESVQTFLVDQFHRTAVVENALVKFWQLRLLDVHARQVEQRPSASIKLQRSLFRAIGEFEQRRLSYGTAEDISSSLSRQLAGDLHQGLRDQINLVGQIVVAERAEAAAKRANRFAASALLVAIFLGIPGIKQSLDYMLAAGEPWTGFPVVSAIKSGAITIDRFLMYVYVGLVVFIAALLFFDRLRGAIRWIGRFRLVWPFGYDWPGREYHIRLSADHDDIAEK